MRASVFKMKDRAHDDVMAEVFRKDPAYAVELLNSILEDGDQGELLIALHSRSAVKSFQHLPSVSASQGHQMQVSSNSISGSGDPVQAKR